MLKRTHNLRVIRRYQSLQHCRLSNTNYAVTLVTVDFEYLTLLLTGWRRDVCCVFTLAMLNKMCVCVCYIR